MSLILSLLLAVNLSTVTRVEYAPDKYVSVYTPTGYTETEQYKVMFLYPSMIFDDQFWFSAHEYDNHKVDTKQFIDEMINEDECETLILVSVSHFDSDEETVRQIAEYIKTHYSVSTNREDWAVGGFSGGADITSLLMGNCNDLFAYYACFSGGLRVAADDLDITYLYMSYGTEDVGMWSVLGLRDSLKSKDLIDDSNSKTIQYDIYGHSWGTAVQGMRAFLPIFTKRGN